MSLATNTIDPTTAAVVARNSPAARGTSSLSALRTLTTRRFALSARTPREILVPLLTPVLFALVIAPALDSIGPSLPGVDYMTFAAIGTAGLLIPLNCIFAGVGVMVDRESGARRDLLAAPIARPLIVAGNLVVALAITALQLAVLIAASVARGADLHTSATRVWWFVGAATLLAIGMYGVAETLANRIPTLEEFIGATPAVAIVPWFFAGSLFPIEAMPAGLTYLARVLPLTHAMALMRYGLVDPSAAGLHDIWGMSNVTVMAALSLGVVALFAALMSVVAVKVFTRAAVQ